MLTIAPPSGDDPNLFHDTHRPTDVHINPVGDVVVCDGVGEVVLLPHLWNFELLTVDDFFVLRTSGRDLGDGKSGDRNLPMTAVLDVDHDLAKVEGVFETSPASDGLVEMS